MTDKYNDSLQSDSDEEYDFKKCDKFEELKSSGDKLSVTDMFKDLMKEIREIKVSQNKILANITKLQTQVNKQEVKITSLEKSQDNLNTRVGKLEQFVQRDFNPVTIVAINAPIFRIKKQCNWPGELLMLLISGVWTSRLSVPHPGVVYMHRKWYLGVHVPVAGSPQWRPWLPFK